MKVLMKSIMAGPEGTAMPRQVVTVDDKTGLDLVRGGYAEPVETAMIAPMENADNRPKIKAKRGK